MQYGCGWCAPEGWRNFDASLRLRIERIPLLGRLCTRNRPRFPDNVEYGDIVKGLPVAERTCDGVYCSHVLEHLSLTDFRTALINTWEILKPGGVFRLVVPDLEHMVEKYINDPTESAAHALMTDTGLGSERRERGFWSFMVAWMGNSKHLWMWDFRSIAAELENAGFASIRRARFGDCPDAAFSEVEDRARWENCLGVECKRPG